MSNTSQKQEGRVESLSQDELIRLSEMVGGWSSSVNQRTKSHIGYTKSCEIIVYVVYNPESYGIVAKHGELNLGEAIDYESGPIKTLYEDLCSRGEDRRDLFISHSRDFLRE